MTVMLLEPFSSITATLKLLPPEVKKEIGRLTTPPGLAPFAVEWIAIAAKAAMTSKAA